MHIRKLIVGGLMCASIFIASISYSFALDTSYTVQAGDTFWKISQKYNVGLQELMAANNATQNTILYIGQEIIIPSNEPPGDGNTHTVQSGDTYWIISQKYDVDILELMKYNGHNENTILYIGQKIKIPGKEPYITYDSHTVQKGDTFWSISIKFGITTNELLKANDMDESTVLNIGDVLKIPVHHIPVKDTPRDQYGEYLDWWTEAQYVIPCGSVFEIVDFDTGKSFMAKRTTGANHADVETLTLEDTAKMKEIWGGEFTWARRPVIIKYNGRKLAASASAMPHAGNDAAPGGLYTSWRSGDYGDGYNFDWVKNNGMDGIFDVHFLNSSRHSNGQIDEKHQENIKIASGIK